MYYKDKEGNPYDNPSTKIIERDNLVEIEESEFKNLVEDINTKSVDEIAEVRAIRDMLLADSDWTQVLDCPIDEADIALWRIYRQALRDVPQQDGFPHSVEWPGKP